MLLIRALLLLAFLPLQLMSKPLQSDVLVAGDTQVSSEIYVYQTIVEDVPIQGSVLITHDSTSKVDINSFRMGDKPLKVEFEQSAAMSSTGTLEVSVYKFMLDGMKNGQHVLPPIVVKVGNKEYQAPPMTVDVGPGAD